MADYQKLPESGAFFTGATSGQLYVKFLAFEGLDAIYTRDNKPAISLQIDRQSDDHSDWSFNPKRLNQVSEILVFIRNRNSKVKVIYRDPVSHQEIGMTVIEPSRMPNTQLATLWFKIHDTARVLVHAYWSAMAPSEKFSLDPRDIASTSFTIILDRPYYLAGETVAGVVVYRPHKTTPLRSVRLQIAGYSRQISDGDFPDETKHAFFTHEAVLLGNLQGDTFVNLSADHYIWTFNFPLPYAIPPSGAAAGNFYYVLAKEVDSDGRPVKTKKLHFGIRRVFYPKELLAPATKTPPPSVDAAAAPTPSPREELSKTHSSVLDAQELGNVRHSVHVAKLMDEDSLEDSGEGEAPKKKKKKDKVKKTTPASAPKAEASAEENDSIGGSEASGDTSEEEDAVVVAAETPEAKKESKPKRRKSHGKGHQQHGNHGNHEHGAESASKESSRNGTPANPGPLKVSKVASQSADGKSSLVVAAAPGGSAAPVKVPLRVKPGLGLNCLPSSGMKHLNLPISVENTTTKPLPYFSISVNYIVERSFRAKSILTGSYEYSLVSRFHVKKFKFKNEPGWPLQVGEKWEGVVNLVLPESTPASIDSSNSPIFTRTYYAKVSAAAKGVFTKQRTSAKYLLHVGDFDWNTRPLPIQHDFDVPIRFTIFTLPCGPSSPAFIADKTAQQYDSAVPTLTDIEQSEAINLEESMAF